MTILRADYFDGKTSTRHPVTLVFSGGKLRVVGQAVDAEFDVQRVRRSLPVGGTPRWFYLPGGGACVTSDGAGADRVSRKRFYERTLHGWESRPLFAGFAVALVAATFWLIIDYGVPAGARVVAGQIPVEAEATLGRESLAALDQQLLKASQLPADRQRALKEKLDRMVKASGATVPYRLEFRASDAFGANALALPAGIVVVTDDLVKLARDDSEVLGVLAHELGHLHHRHTMRRLLEASATALIVAGVTGDLASASSLVASAPALLVQTKFSRENEREADRYAIDMLRKAGIDPGVLGDILGRLEAKSGGPGIPDFLSSHPATEERIALSRARSATGERK
jgi:predicted Zn-dependent protease